MVMDSKHTKVRKFLLSLKQLLQFFMHYSNDHFIIQSLIVITAIFVKR